MLIFETLEEILKLKPVGYSEIASISGKKKLDVIKCLNKNAHLLVFNKSGRVTGFKDIVATQKAEAYKSGLTYYIKSDNYGTIEIISTKNGSDEVMGLYTSQVFGGFGDSYRVDVIVATPENISKIESLGIVSIDDFRAKTVRELWEE